MLARKPVIAFVIPSLRTGGAELQLVRLAKEVQDLGHAVHVLALDSSGPCADLLRRWGVPYSGTGFPPEGVHGFIRALRLAVVPVNLLRALLRVRPTIVHAWLLPAFTLALPLSWLARVPVRIQGRRGLNSGFARSRRARLARIFTALFTNYYTANSRSILHELVETESVDPTLISVIPNGVDLPSEIADVAATSCKGVVLANLIAYKGHTDLIEALKFSKTRPPMIFVGDGRERGTIERMISHAQLQDRIELIGSCSTPTRLLLESQFLVLPSHTEGLPNAVLEAMACGLPVIATDVGGVRELVIDGVTGIVVPPHDPPALAAAIDRLVSDTHFRVEAGREGRNAATRFSWPTIAKSYLEVYLSLSSRLANE